ncbi:MAG: LysR family transcriptional regulator [Alphaproteobacteria bacterium]
MSTLNPDRLRTLALVVELGAFSRAAERLGVSQPAASQHVRQLEDALGVRLVERVGKRTRATRAGEALLVHARRIAADLDAAAAEMARFREGVVERVRIGTGATTCIYLLPPVLGRLKRRFPDLQISVRTGDTRDMALAIEANELDVGLVTLPIEGAMLSVTPALAEPFVAISPAEAGPAGDARANGPLTPAALAAGPLMLYEAGGNTRRLADDWFRRAGVAVEPTMELGSIEAIKALVAAGLGRAILPASAVADPARRQGVAVHALDPPLGRELAIVLRKDKRLTAGLRATVAGLGALSLDRLPI